MAGELAASVLSHKVSDFILIASLKKFGISLAIKILKNRIKVIEHKLQKETEITMTGLDEKSVRWHSQKGGKK